MILTIYVSSSGIEDDAKYLIVESNDLNRLAQVVNEYIKEGWLPLGGVAVSRLSARTQKQYTQSMTKFGGKNT